MLAAVALVGTMAACSDDDKTAPAVNIEKQTVTIDSNQPGKVVFHWTTPEHQTTIILRWLTTTPQKVTACSTPAPMPIPS